MWCWDLDGRHILLGTSAGNVYCVDTTDGNLSNRTKYFQGENFGQIMSIKCSKNGHILVSGSNKTFHVYDRRDLSRPIKKIESKTKQIFLYKKSPYKSISHSTNSNFPLYFQKKLKPKISQPQGNYQQEYHTHKTAATLPSHSSAEGSQSTKQPIIPKKCVKSHQRESWQ